MKVEKTNNGKKGGLLKGKPHYDKDGNSLGGIKAVVTDSGNRPVELEGGEVIINKEASKKHWKLLSKINQSAGGGVPIGPPSGADFDEDPEEFKEGGRIIEFNPNHVPNKWVVQYAEKIKKDHPEIWKLGGNIFGNQAFENLLRVSKRGYWLDSEEWMYIKWRSYVARHIHDFRIEGVVAMLKWCDKVEKGWAYMKDLIEEKIDKIESKEEKASTKMTNGDKLAERYDGLMEEKYSIADKIDKLSPLDWRYDKLKERLTKINKQLEKIEKSNPKMATGGSIQKQTTGNKILDKLAKLLKQPKATIEITSNQVRSVNGKFSFSEPSTFFVKKSPSNDYYFLMTNKGTYRVEEKDVTKAEDLYDELESIIQAGRTKRAVECDLSGNPIMAKGGEVGKIAPDRINELSATLLNQLKRYAKENYNEDVIDDTFMLKGEEKNGDFQVEEVTIDTTSGRDIHITIQELFMKKGGELAKGIKAELEHKKTIEKIYNRKVSKSKAAELIAKDHLKEDPKYYSKLEKIEGKKFATGSTIEKFDIGDRVYLNTKKGKIEVIVTKYSDKWVQFDDLTKGKSGRWKATPEFKEEFDSFVNQPASTTITQATSTPTTNGFKVGDIVEWAETIPNYGAKKGDKAKVVGIEPEKEWDLVIEWITPTAQSNGNYYSSHFIKAKNQVLPKSSTIKEPEPQPQPKPQAQQLVKEPTKRQTKIEEPEPVGRKFIEGKDYLKIFTEYFEKDTEKARVVNSESFTKAIVNDFIIATEDIGGFSKDKLKEIKSFIDKE